MISFFNFHDRLTIILAIATIGSAVWLCITRKRLRMNILSVLILSIAHTVFGVLSVKLFSYMETGFTKFEGLSMFGGLLILPVFYLILAFVSKRRLGDVCDAFAIPLAFTLALARINCLFAGCCLGKPIGFISGSTLRYPTREIELLFYAVYIAIFITMYFKSKARGKALPWFMLSYGVFRFFVEFFRDNDNVLREPFHISHIWAVLSFVIGLSVLLYMRYRKPKPFEIDEPKKTKKKRK